ncbi:MAG: hypothetical protein OEM52_02540 [bacterium]|nr:hypothetical protein [bacterium]
MAIFLCRCEERSDEAIPVVKKENEIATSLPSVSPFANGRYFIAFLAKTRKQVIPKIAEASLQVGTEVAITKFAAGLITYTLCMTCASLY